MNPFLRICFANLLMFGSLYLLIPVLPGAFAERMDVPLLSTGRIFLVFTAGMLIAGSAHSYLIDTYRKKYLLTTSLAVMLIITAGYYFINRPLELFLYPLIHGMAFSIANLSLTTVSIDITTSNMRDKNNVIYGWFSRSGMILGIAAGSFGYMNFGLDAVLYTSAGLLAAGLLFIFSVNIPFRAPIGTSFFSTDRFILPRTWILFINMVLIAFVPGVFLSITCLKLSSLFTTAEVTVPYFVPVALGFILSAVVMKSGFRKKDIPKQIVLGLAVMVASVSLFILSAESVVLSLSALLLGIGMGIVSSLFLFMFINLPYHCQRGSANNTYLLAWKIGISSGIALSCHLQAESSQEFAFLLAMFSAAAALIFFVIATQPYYKRSCSE